MNKKLIKEFESAGASGSEAEEFALISKNISNLFNFERSKKTKHSFLDQLEEDEIVPASNIYYKRLLFFLPLIVLLFVIFGSLLSVNASKPGDALYPIKRASEDAASYINKNFMKSEGINVPSANLESIPSPQNTQITP